MTTDSQAEREAAVETAVFFNSQVNPRMLLCRLCRWEHHRPDCLIPDIEAAARAAGRGEAEGAVADALGWDKAEPWESALTQVRIGVEAAERIEALLRKWERESDELITYATQVSESVFGHALQKAVRELRALLSSEGAEGG